MTVAKIMEMFGAGTGIAESMGNWVVNRPFSLSIDKVRSHQSEHVDADEAIYIRAKVQLTKYAQTDERCSILLQKMWRDGVLIEWEKSPLQWAGHDSFEPLHINVLSGQMSVQFTPRIPHE